MFLRHIYPIQHDHYHDFGNKVSKAKVNRLRKKFKTNMQE